LLVNQAAETTSPRSHRSGGRRLAVATAAHNASVVKDPLDPPTGLWLPRGMSRRSFLKLTGLAAAGAAILPYGFVQAVSAIRAPDSLASAPHMTSAPTSNGPIAASWW
jgi:hypothetical protein